VSGAATGTASGLGALRVLIIGCGSIGQRHLRNLRALRPDAEILAFRQRNRHAAALKAEFGLGTVGSLAAGLAARPDFAIIANPTAQHLPVALEAARAGVPLLIEKPLSHDWTGVDELRRIVAERRLPSLVAFNLRFHPGLRRLKALLDEGKIGRLLSFRVEVGQYLPDWHPKEDYRDGYSARRDQGGGAILDLTHELDYAAWLAGPPSSVMAMADRVSDLDIDTEDLAEIVLRCGRAIGSVHLDYLARSPARGCRLVGSEGTLTWDYFGGEVALFEAATGQWSRERQGDFDRNDMYRAELEHFLECLAGRATPIVDVSAGAASLALALAARRSAETGQTIHTAPGDMVGGPT
jgi:predicted dehydrogenase